MNKHKRLNGLIAAAFTPMHDNGELNLQVIAPYAEMLIEAGIPGVFICGTTGESASLTLTERKLITEEWVKQSSGRLKVIVHVGSNCQADAIELARHAQTTGAMAIAAMSPGFFKPASAKELVRFFVPIAEAAGEIPFYYYHMPSMTGITLSCVDFLPEAEKAIPTFAGIKFTHNNMMEMGECIAYGNGKYEILNGYDETLIAGMAFGAKSGVGSTYNYIPEVYQAVVEAVNEGNIEAALAAQMKSIEIVNIIIKYGGGVRGGKAIMNLKGIKCGSCRPPIAPFSEEEYERLGEEVSGAELLQEVKEVPLRSGGKGDKIIE